MLSSPARSSACSSAQDLLLFYAFFEAMLIPLYVLVGVWGGPGVWRDAEVRHLHDGRIAR
jgi:NADH:ubiquinone oxidoreductase subunit 4 (subunit M)